MTIQEALEKLQSYEKATFALNHATGLMYYDGATTAPKGTAELRGSTLGELSRMGYELTTAPETVEMLRTLMENREELDPVTRRKAEELIEQGLVTVNGRRAVIGQKVNPKRDLIAVDGQKIDPREQSKKIYVALHKPRGFVTTMSDELGRRCVAELVADTPARVYPIGRLDRNSEGLLLLTNDGELASRLMHPKQEIEKVYLLWVSHYAPGAERSLAEPLEIDGRKTSPARVELLRVNLEAPSQTADSRRTESHAECTEKPATALLRITIHEGRKRQIRRLAERAGLTVTRLKRIAEGPLRLGDLAPGQYRSLTDEELEMLQNHS